MSYITFGDLQDTNLELKEKQALSSLNLAFSDLPDLSDLRSNDQPNDQHLDQLNAPLALPDPTSTPSPNYPVSKTRGIGFPVSKTPRTLDTPSPKNPLPNLLDTSSPKDPLKGYFLPNWIDDELMPSLEIIEQIILRRIIRLSLGFNRSITDPVSISKLAQKCNVSETPLKKAIKSLENKGILRVHRDLSGNKYAGGNKYEFLALPDSYGSSKTPRTQNTPSPNALSTDHDHDLNITNHHQKETMMIYHSLTGNSSWTKSDSAAYQKLKHLSVLEISNLIQSTLLKLTRSPLALLTSSKPTLTFPFQLCQQTPH